MADLSGQPADPAMEPAVEDDTGRDPGPDAEIDEVVGAAELGVAMEADGGGPDVVLDDARDAEARGQAAPEWKMPGGPSTICSRNKARGRPQRRCQRSSATRALTHTAAALYPASTSVGQCTPR